MATVALAVGASIVLTDTDDAAVAQGLEPDGSQTLVAFDVGSGARLWRHSFDNDQSVAVTSTGIVVTRFDDATQAVVSSPGSRNWLDAQPFP